jgi:hypothetical protein
MLQPRGASAPEVAEKLVVLVVEENAVCRSAYAERLDLRFWKRPILPKLSRF